MSRVVFLCLFLGLTSAISDSFVYLLPEDILNVKSSWEKLHDERVSFFSSVLFRMHKHPYPPKAKQLIKRAECTANALDEMVASLDEVVASLMEDVFMTTPTPQPIVFIPSCLQLTEEFEFAMFQELEIRGVPDSELNSWRNVWKLLSQVLTAPAEE